MRFNPWARQLAVIAGILFVMGFSTPTIAKVKAVATTADLHAILTEVGGDHVETSLLCRGDQDPHALEAKPSLMMQVNRADVVFAIGMELEVGWLPNVLSGARNPKIAPGQSGYVEVGPTVEPMDVPSGRVTRAQGDIHPAGNPHVTLDPVRAGNIARLMAQKLGELDTAHAADYSKRAEALQQRLQDKVKTWQGRIDKAGVKKVITYHKTLTYFLARFGVETVMVLEPIPGVPPSAKHLMEVIRTAKEQKVTLALIENFFSPAAGERVAKDVPGLRVAVVPVAVGSRPDVKSIDDLYEALVETIAGRTS